MRTVLITGANKGIGFEVARQLGKAGDRILVGARNVRLGQEATERLRAEGIDARFVELDVQKQETIAAAARSIEALDVLINNAGVVDPGDGAPSGTKLESVRRIFDTNFFGVLAVTQAFLPRLRESSAARIVNVSSSLGSLTLHSDPSWPYSSVNLTGYNASKAALNMLTVGLANELRDTAIKVNAVNPGYTATDLNAHQGHITVAEGALPVVALASLDVATTGGFFGEGGQREPW